MTREELGRIVHHEWRRWAIDQRGIDPDGVLGWEDRDEGYREVCMLQAEAVSSAVRAEIAARLTEFIVGMAWPTPRAAP